MSGEEKISETIKIGICADLDTLTGRGTHRGAILAAEQINEQGGLLGKTIEIIAEDSDGNSQNPDITIDPSEESLLDSMDKIVKEVGKI